MPAKLLRVSVCLPIFCQGARPGHKLLRQSCVVAGLSMELSSWKGQQKFPPTLLANCRLAVQSVLSILLPTQLWKQCATRPASVISIIQLGSLMSTWLGFHQTKTTNCPRQVLVQSLQCLAGKDVGAPAPHTLIQNQSPHFHCSTDPPQPQS